MLEDNVSRLASVPQKVFSSIPPEGKKFVLKRVLIAALVIIITAGGGFYLWQKGFFEIKDSGYIKPDYTETYRLVPEKVSQSAGIVIRLPEGVSNSIAKQNIEFEPAIKGKWLDSEQGEVVFKPKEQLELYRYYSVKLTYTQSPPTVLEADFLSVEDPEIVAVFPAENSETPEDSEITIVFNRPMVPLTTLGYLERQEVPVEIIPFTEGRFKWITTRNLQFIPDERLKRSSNYEVKIITGLTSMDGLGLAGKSVGFTTRKLRYLDKSYQTRIVTHAYNQPIVLRFNQPVDLEKTKRMISLQNLTDRKAVPFIAEYALKQNEDGRTRGIWGFGEKNEPSLLAKIGNGFGLSFLSNILWLEESTADASHEDLEVDQTIIHIYNQQDRFGREKLWDFERSYSLTVEGAYPLEGDISLSQKRIIKPNITGVIRSMTAESERTKYASPSFFDPQGRLWVSFYEEIDLDESEIKADDLQEIGYGEKCEEGSQDYYYSSADCKKVIDKTKIYLIFKENEVGFGETLRVTFEKLVNIDGLSIIKDPINRSVVSFPRFEILKVLPANNTIGASLTEMIICSNSPLVKPEEEELGNYFKTNLDYEFNYWGSSYKVQYSNDKCSVGQFKTIISYGLIPLVDYVVTLNLEDVFSQKADHTSVFTTKEMDSSFLGFSHLQRYYNVTSLDKTQLTYAVRNMDYINLEICKLDALSFLYYLNDKPSITELPSAISGCSEIKRKTIFLPKRYWLKNYFQVNIKDYFEEPIGHFVLTFHHPQYKQRRWNSALRVYEDKPAYQRSYLTVTNLAVAEKRIEPSTYFSGSRSPIDPADRSHLRNLYWVTRLSDLEPQANAKIDLYQKYKDKFVFADSYLTNTQGVAESAILDNLGAVVVSHGMDSTVILTSQSKLEYASSAFSAEKFYIYTDKPIYRPSDKVFIKGIYRVGYDGSYQIYSQDPVKLTVRNSRGDEILNKQLFLNDFGTFSTDIVLDENAPLGMYRICIEGNYSCAYFDIQEYVPSAFEVDVKTDKEEYISKDEVNFEVVSNYYFGVPLEGGEVEYTISSQGYYFDRYIKEWFRFSAGRSYYGWPYYQYGDRFLLRGKAFLDSQGVAQFSQIIDFEELFGKEEDRTSKIIVADFTVTDQEGRSVSKQKSFLMHAGQFYLGLKPDKSFLAKDESFETAIKSVDTEGEPISVSKINLELYRLNWLYSKRLGPDGAYHYQWEQEKELIETWKASTDRNGDFSQKMKIAKEGSYLLKAFSKDKKGNSILSTYNLYVHGRGAVSIKPTQGTELEIEVEKSNFAVGEKANVVIKSPYKKAKALIAIERGEIFEYQIEEIEGNLYNYAFEIKENYAPNIYLSALLLSGEPEVKFGKVQFKIDTERKELDVKVVSEKNYYLPGEEITLNIEASDFIGSPVSAEFSIGVVDLSVLALKGNPKKDPVVFFYGGFPLTVSTGSNIKNILTEYELTTKGGGGAAGSPDASEDLARKKRGVFKETAFWQAVVRTDTQGKAQVKFTLPDNLTTWQAEALGVTKDTKVGVGYHEFSTRKELMVISLKPRFVVPGDTFYIGAKVFNQSQGKQKLSIRFESSTLRIVPGEKIEKKLSLKPSETGTVYFKVTANSSIDEGVHVFQLSAKAGKLEDTVENIIKITRNETYETTATANFTTDNLVKEYVFLPDNVVKDRGKLSIKASATLAVFLSDALDYLIGYPYGCAEQIASRLKSLAIVKKVSDVPNLEHQFNLNKIKFNNKEYTIEEIIEIGLSKIDNNQQWDGGFSYWPGGKSNFHLTLHIVDTLTYLSEAGFEVNLKNLDDAANFLLKKITQESIYYRNKNNVILTAYTLFRVPGFNDRGVLRQKLDEFIKDELFIREQISSSALAYLIITLEEAGFAAASKEKVWQILGNRVDIDSRGAFIENGKSWLWYYYETPIKNTALYLKALSLAKRENPLTDKLIRWILNSKAKDRAWGSTNNTLTVIDAFSDFLLWQRETESDFTLEVLLNGSSKDSFRFYKGTILEEFNQELKLQDLVFNKNNTIEFEKTNHNTLENRFYYDMALKYYLPADRIPPRDEGFTITRQFYNLDDKKNKDPLIKAEVGEIIRGHLQIIVPEPSNFVAVEDYIPAGFEIVNLELATEQKSLRLQEKELTGREFRPDFKEIRDDRVFLYEERMSAGLYEFDYFLRALTAGRFTHLPAQIFEMYFPENFGRTEGSFFEIE